MDRVKKLSLKKYGCRSRIWDVTDMIRRQVEIDEIDFIAPAVFELPHYTSPVVKKKNDPGLYNFVKQTLYSSLT